MQFPFEPKALLHKHGGQIVKVHGITHEIGKPEDGYSRDHWYFLGEVRWRDGGTSKDAHIAPYQLCYDTDTGHDEIRQLSSALTDYLAEHGEWCDRKSKHEGWYANDRQVRRRA